MVRGSAGKGQTTEELPAVARGQRARYLRYPLDYRPSEPAYRPASASIDIGGTETRAERQRMNISSCGGAPQCTKDGFACSPVAFTPTHHGCVVPIPTTIPGKTPSRIGGQEKTRWLLALDVVWRPCG